MIKTDCIYFDYEEDMGKSIPYCKVKKHKCTPCMCDTESNYIDDCGDCDRYVRKDYINNKLDYKVINRGKCMICGKELTEGLFFCKECEQKGGKE